MWASTFHIITENICYPTFYLYLNESIHPIYLCSNLWSWSSSNIPVYNIYYKYYVPLHISLYFYHREYYMAYAHQNPVMSDALLRFTGEWNAIFYNTIGRRRRRRRRHFLCFCWWLGGMVFCSKSMCVWCVWWWMECMHEYMEATHHVHHIYYIITQMIKLVDKIIHYFFSLAHFHFLFRFFSFSLLWILFSLVVIPRTNSLFPHILSV